MQLNADYWNNHYLENETGWDAKSITTPLKKYFDQLKNKSISILIPGAGNSYEAEYFIKKGFKNIFVLDYAEEPLKNFRINYSPIEAKRRRGFLFVKVEPLFT